MYPNVSGNVEEQAEVQSSKLFKQSVNPLTLVIMLFCAMFVLIQFNVWLYFDRCFVDKGRQKESWKGSHHV